MYEIEHLHKIIEASKHKHSRRELYLAAVRYANLRAKWQD